MFAQLRYLVSCSADPGQQCALVQSLIDIDDNDKDESRKALGLPWLKLFMLPYQRGRELPSIGWISLESIEGPAHLQPDPVFSGLVF